MDEVLKIVSDIQKGEIKPIYLLMGEESYFIDKISDFIEDTVLQESEKAFDQMVFYGQDISVSEIIDYAKRYPMIGEKQVIIIKEAQDLIRTFENLTNYAENPQPTTILVFCYKYKTVDKRKKVYKAIQKSGVVFESKKMYDNKVPEWIKAILQQKSYKIDTKAALMLVDFLGNDLSKISKELEKLMVVVPVNSTISPKDIEDNIGISKDFNNFELRKAIGDKDILRVNRIINYFGQNQKANPIVVTLSLLNSYFTQLLIYHSLKDKSSNAVARSLGVSPFFVKDYIDGAKNYPMRKISQIISFLREADVKSKGVGANSVPASDILKELMFKILH
ncbi:DNA polymerase III subunit delta [Lutibacter sp.]|uniref:DNA polymerase III subunit delta n=1 Tax=Lutibacter sp. TaxID=1925666 RepID=UPI0027377323|nr:DNA polymerase III subunit delta [Lutibacter sp.]MDP3313522.1 DNA polymerase III subunit delta [Lutibacter sp.]